MRPNYLYRTGRQLVRLYASLLMRFDVHFHTPLPSGPKIFVANHPSATDPFLIHLLSYDEINVLLTGKAFRVRLFGVFLRRVNEICVPLEAPAQALATAQERLAAGRSVAIFIEGRISPGESGFLPPRTGAARLALETGLPVVPVGIYLRRDWRLNIQSKIAGQDSEALWYLYGPYFVTVGSPMVWQGDVQDRLLVRQIAGEMMEQIKELARESEARYQRQLAAHGLMRLLDFLHALRRRSVTLRL